jgi:aminopeptidase C
MKFLELTGFGNKHKHLISLRSIADIEFGMSYTHISLTNGSVVNVIEDEKEIMDMIKYQNGDVVNAQFIENINAQIEAWNEMEADRFYSNDDLPF